MVISTALTRFLKTVYISGSRLSDLMQTVVDEVEASRVATAKAEKDIEWQKEPASIVQKPINNALNGVASLCGRVTATGTREAELFSSTSVSSR